jgi:hypothetical protein
MDMGWSSTAGEMTQVEEPEVAMMEEKALLRDREKKSVGDAMMLLR